MEKLYNQGADGETFDALRYSQIDNKNVELVYIDQSDATVVLELLSPTNQGSSSNIHFGIDIDRVPETTGTHVMSLFKNGDANNGSSFHDFITVPLDSAVHSFDIREGNTKRRGVRVVHTRNIRKDRAVLFGFQAYSDNLNNPAQKFHTLVLGEDSTSIAQNIIEYQFG